jgi:hypothetical protein
MPAEYSSYHTAHIPSDSTASEDQYNRKYEDVVYLVTQTKLIHRLQQSLSQLSTEAQHSMMSIIRMYLANETLHTAIENRSDLVSMTKFFNEFQDSDKFWSTFYEHHSKNTMIQNILDLVSKEPKSVAEVCLESGVDTSMAYSMMLRTKLNYLPSDPRPTGVSWYDFLHPGATKMSLEAFKAVLNENNLRLAFAYDQWRDGLSAERRAQLPSVSHIMDGYFMGKKSFGEVVA